MIGTLTALHKDVRVVERLLAEGADANAKSRAGEPALLLAVYAFQNIAVIRRLLAANADVNLADAEGNTPLIVCVRDSELSVVRLRVKRGAHLDARNADGDTPLTDAACWGSGRVVDFLIRHGAGVSLRDGVGLTRATLARQQGYDGIAPQARIRAMPRSKIGLSQLLTFCSGPSDAPAGTRRRR